MSYCGIPISDGYVKIVNCRAEYKECGSLGSEDSTNWPPRVQSSSFNCRETLQRCSSSHLCRMFRLVLTPYRCAPKAPHGTILGTKLQHSWLLIMSTFATQGGGEELAALCVRLPSPKCHCGNLPAWHCSCHQDSLLRGSLRARKWLWHCDARIYTSLDC